VERLLTDWLAHAKLSLRPRSYERYESLCRVHLVPGLGKRRVATLTPHDIQAFLDAKLASGLAPRSVQYLHATLRVALGYAERLGLVSRNAAKLAKPPRIARPEVQPFTAEEARRLLEAACGHRLEALFVTALGTGLREAELLGLRWQDVDLERGLLTVRVQLQRINGKLTLTEPKTERSRRTLQLPAMVREALEERLAAGPLWEDSGLVFTTAHGAPLDARNVIRLYQERILPAAGLPRRPFHVLRHSAATFLLASGCDLRTVQQVLGHSQVSLTANLYAHVMPTLLRDAADKLDVVLGG
jgi:integrase